MKKINIPLNIQDIILKFRKDLISRKDQIILDTLHALVDPEDINFRRISVKHRPTEETYYYQEKPFLIFYKSRVIIENNNLYLQQEYRFPIAE